MATLTLELPESVLKRIELSARRHGRTIEDEAAELLESAIKVWAALDKANEKAAVDALEIEDLKEATAEIRKYAPGFLDRVAADFNRRKARIAEDDILLATLTGRANIGALPAEAACTKVDWANLPLIEDKDELLRAVDEFHQDMGREVNLSPEELKAAITEEHR